MRGFPLSELPLRHGALACAALASLLIAGTAAAGDAPTYGVRLYELFQRGPKLVMAERTTRVFAPRHIRNLELGQVWPPEDQDPMKVYRSRDHLDFFGSYWREDGANDFGLYEVEVWEVDDADEPGIAYIRIRLLERKDLLRSPKRRMKHPERDAVQRAKHGN